MSFHNHKSKTLVYEISCGMPTRARDDEMTRRGLFMFCFTPKASSRVIHKLQINSSYSDTLNQTYLFTLIVQ